MSKSGPLLGITTADGVNFYEWESSNFVQRIDKNFLNVYPAFRPMDVAW